MEGPLIFVACYDLVLNGVKERREETELRSVSVRSRATRSGDEVEVPVNEIAFVDDLLPFLIFKSWEHLTGWIQAVIEVFEANHLKANVGKLEILLEAVGHGNARTNREINAGKMVITVGGHKLVLKKKATYLGVCLDISGSAAGEIDERMTKAKRAHARLANRVWKSRLLTWRVKWRLWQALVLSVSDLLLGGSYPYGGDDNKAGEMGDEMPPTNCESTGTCDPRVKQCTAEKIQGGHNWIDSGAQAASFLEETTTTMGSERRPPRHIPPASPGLLGSTLL